MRVRRVRWVFILSAAMALVPWGAPSAQGILSTRSTSRDSAFAMSLVMRSWPTLTGTQQGMALGFQGGYAMPWLRLRMAGQLASSDRGGNGLVAPYVLDGRAELGTTPVAMRSVNFDAHASLERDAVDPSNTWMQGKATMRGWYGNSARGIAATISAVAPRDARATPTSTEARVDGWYSMANVRFNASFVRVQTGRLVPVTGDSVQVFGDGCRVNYDARRPLQQYRRICPQRLRAGDVFLGMAWSPTFTNGLLNVRAFAAHRLLGGDSEGPYHESWAGGSVEFDIKRGTVLVTEFARYPTNLVRGLPAHRRFALGARMYPALWNNRRHESDNAIQGAGVTSAAGASYTFVLGEAQRAEIRADFTNWQPVSLTPGRRGHWTYAGPIPPGVHSLSVRVNGGAWRAPPGLPTDDDGFGGTVGVLVIER